MFGITSLRCTIDNETSAPKRTEREDEMEYNELVRMKPEQTFSKNCAIGRLMGKVMVNVTVPKTLKEVEDFLAFANLLHGIERGGLWKPRDCKPLRKIAVIIPFRKRAEHLRVILRHLHPILQRQMVYYRIFVVEQAGSEPFNKGRTLNAGVKEALKYDHFDCLILHDVDLLAKTDKLRYDCAASPYLMCVKLDETITWTLFGGVITLTLEHYKDINGLSNRYWKWGHEDDDMYFRLYGKRYEIFRAPSEIGDCEIIKAHHYRSDRWNPENVEICKKVEKQSIALHDNKSSDHWIYAEGFSSVEYNLIKVEEHSLYTFFSVILEKSKY